MHFEEQVQNRAANSGKQPRETCKVEQARVQQCQLSLQQQHWAGRGSLAVSHLHLHACTSISSSADGQLPCQGFTGMAAVEVGMAAVKAVLCSRGVCVCVCVSHLQSS